MSQIDNLHEILRGKHKQSGEWVYGEHIAYVMSGKQISNVYLVHGDAYYLVLYDTIGKSVGADKIGDRIFEDDMVKTKDGIGIVEWDDLASRFVIKFEYFSVEFDNDIEMKVVGNTFDGITDERWL